MQLGELLPHIDQNMTVFIYLDGKCISYYDGKNSIPEEHNALYINNDGIRCVSGAIEISVSK